MERIKGLLPGGYTDEAGVVHRDVEVSPLSGGEEELLCASGSSAKAVSAILSRCVRRIGGIQRISEDLARSLLVADRLYLLLKLQEATFGERVQATIGCYNSECSSLIDIDFSIGEVPIVESESKAIEFSVELSPDAAFEEEDGVICSEIAFRLPNGWDQEVVTPLISDSEILASETLLARCVTAMGETKNPGIEGIRRFSSQARMEIERHMEEVAPQVELIMEGECPECGSEFSTPFDIQGFFFREMMTNLPSLYREVHYLAYHYHWSEREIMQMPRQKRRRYIEVLSDEIERLNDAIIR